jgi:NAD(P)-dependent dehydrogenase (short-subunit alcohol dehydrogenase family)
VPDDAPTARLAGKHAVVTGAARGIGLAIAEGLLAAGATVLGTDLLAEEGRSAFAALGERASFEPMDVTDERAWSALAAQLGARAPDVLVNNAGGLLSSAPLHEHSLEDWQRTLTLNLTSVFLGMRAMIPLMVAAGAGSIVNITSVSGVLGQDDAPAYQAAKAGIAVLTRNAAVTYARQRIRVNAISPSVISTAALATESDERTARFLARVPMGRPGSPAEVAAAVVYLASDEAAYVTGVNLPVDGGYLA